MHDVENPPMDAQSAIRAALIGLDGRSLRSLTYHELQQLLVRLVADVTGMSRDDPTVRLYATTWFHELHGQLLHQIRLYGLAR